MAAPDISRVDAVLVERPGAVGKPVQQEMSVVVEIPDDRYPAIGLVPKPRHDRGDRPSRLLIVHGNPHQLAAGLGQRPNLLHCRGHVGGIRVGHGLHHDRMIRADRNSADQDSRGGATRHARKIGRCPAVLPSCHPAI